MSNLPYTGATYGISQNGQEWISGPNSILVSPGDLITVNASGQVVRLPIGGNGTTLVSNGTTLSYQAASGAGTVTSVTSANSDISVANTTTTPVLTLNSATANTASTIVRRDSSGNFSAGTITAALTGTASGNELPLTFSYPLTRSTNTIGFNYNSSVLQLTSNALDIIPDGTNQRVNILNNGTSVGTRKSINFIPGTNITYTVTDNSGSNRVDVTVNSSAGGGTVTSVTSANADISITNTTTTPVLTVNSSITPAAGKIVKYDTNANIETNNLQSATSSKTANYTLTLTDHTVEFDTTSGALTATLPTAASASGLEYVVSIKAGTNSLTIAANGAETINGTNSWTVNNVGSALSVQSDGTSWTFT